MNQNLLAPMRRSRKVVAAYGAMLVGTLIVLAVILTAGERPTSPHAASAITPRATAPGEQALLHVLLALAAVVVAGRAVGAGMRYLGQPPVIGEVLAGIMLGPSLLGRVAPAAQAFLLPPSVAPHLGMLAQAGVILYMFLVGLELNTELLRHRGHAAVVIAHAGIVAPFLLGSVLALALYPALAGEAQSFMVFALFLGVAMSVTAFPVLARILTDRREAGTALGVLALTCAAAGDATAWCLLALVTGLAQAQVGAAARSVLLTLLYIGAMYFCVRPALSRFGPRLLDTPPTRNTLALVLCGLLLSALATEAIGIHGIFGAFLLGAIIPHDSDLARDLVRKLEDFVSVLLLPAFFAYTGLRTEISLISGLESWLLCGTIVLVATAGKFFGTLAAARLTGLGWRAGACLGVLMNTRGLMELIVLNVGLDLGVISPTLFAMLVVMALATTIATTPVLSAISNCPPPATR